MNIQPGFTASEGAGIFNWLRGFGATDKVDAKKKKKTENGKEREVIGPCGDGGLLLAERGCS
jgi:hypothetical protein